MSELIVSLESEKDAYYRTINLTAMLDKSLSLQAKGLHYYIQTRPKPKEETNTRWKMWTKNLFSFSTNKETSVRAALNELLSARYLYRVQLRDEKKKIRAHVYISFSEPTNLDLENLDLENLNVGFKVYSYNIISYNNSSLVISKDIISNSDELPNSNKRIPPKRKKQSKPIFKEYDYLIDLWNNFEFTPKLKKETARLDNIKRFLNQLENGTFSKINLLSEKFLKQNPEIDPSYKFTKQELQEAIEDTALFYKGGYWPENKDKKKGILVGGLEGLIYNSKTKNSWFLKQFFYPPEPLQSQYKMPEVYGIWLDVLFENNRIRMNQDDLPEKDEYRLRTGLLSIEDYYEHLLANNPEVSRSDYSRLSSEHALFQHYIDWIDEKYANYEDLNAYMIGTEAKQWYQFLKWLENVIDIKLT